MLQKCLMVLLDEGEERMHFVWHRKQKLVGVRKHQNSLLTTAELQASGQYFSFTCELVAQGKRHFLSAMTQSNSQC